MALRIVTASIAITAEHLILTQPRYFTHRQFETRNGMSARRQQFGSGVSRDAAAFELSRWRGGCCGSGGPPAFRPFKV